MHREVVGLVVLCVLAVAGFVLTRAAAAANRQLRLRDAALWYEAGQRELAVGQTKPAITALRRASAIDRDERRYQLALAAALAADRQDEAARQVLLGIRTATPEDPSVNVQLARLAARQNDRAAAERYYRSAVYGLWGLDEEDARRQIRIELIRYLLGNHEQGRALSELLVLRVSVPDDPALQVQVGQLFLAAGDPRLGRDHFERALRADPGRAAALEGAGEAAFDMGDYVAARRYLRGVSHPSPQLARLHDVSDLVLTRDPARPRLPIRTRHDLAVSNLDAALEALDECVASGNGGEAADSGRAAALREAVTALKLRLPLVRLRHATETIDSAVDLTGRIERQRRDMCEGGTPLDEALTLVAERHLGERQ